MFIHFANTLTPQQECENKIYRECNHKSQFTDEEIDNARKYVQQRFAKTNRKKPPCSKFHVRKNIKCLTEIERKKFIDVYKKNSMTRESLTNSQKFIQRTGLEFISSPKASFGIDG